MIHGFRELVNIFAQILKQLMANHKEIKKMEERLMANMTDLLARVTVLSSGVTALGGGLQHLKDLIQALKDQIASGGDTQPAIDAVDAEIARLAAMTTDANAQS